MTKQEQAFEKFIVSKPSETDAENLAKTGCRGILDNSAYTVGVNTFALDVTTSATHRRYRAFRGIFQGMLLDVYSKTSWTPAAQISVQSVDEVAGTFEGSLDNALAATADEWYLFRAGRKAAMENFEAVKEGKL